jgi:hypothetical protein
MRPKVFGQAPQQAVAEFTSPLEVVPPSQEFRDELPLLGDESSHGVEAEVYASVTLRIPQSLYDEYAKIAAAQGMSVEEVLQHRLAKCKTHNTLRGLWFSDSEHAQLEKLLKKWPLENASQALTLISQASVLELDDFKLSLSIPQRKVLGIRTRHGMSPQQIFEAMLRREFQV